MADEDQFDASNSSDFSDDGSQGREEIDTSVMIDMAKLEDTFKEMRFKFRMIDRIGEGTFSTVYKAEDLQYDHYYNDWDIESNDNAKWISPPTKRRKKSDFELSSPNDHQSQRRKRRYVAIKKIYATSSPARIQNELELLHELRGCDSVCPLITAFRNQDQVVAVLPYFRHQDFRMFYRDMNTYDIRVYFRSLFQALAAVHKHGIIHRDIKPTNFLYDVERGRGVLVDFGLAEREGTECSHCFCQESASGRRDRLEASKAANPVSTGYPKNDQRPSRRANRAGTRGFRAPEVLLKCTAQTVKIDTWAAGVILLTILAQRFPFFNSADDVEAFIEIASIFGQRRMKACSNLHGAVFECTLPTIGEKGYSLGQIVQWSTCQVRPEEGNVLSPEIKKTVKFLESLLELDPKKRFSSKQALMSDFLAEDSYCETDADEIDILAAP